MKNEPSYTVGENVNQYSIKEISVAVPKKTKRKLPYDPAISPLGIHLKEGKSAYNRETCTPVCTVALFTIVKSWNQPRCPSTNKWIKRMWSIYTMKYSSSIKNEIMPIPGNGQNWRSSC
jgi:hypothetical protein